MIRIAISCGEGFSSGFLAFKLEKEVVEKHMEERAFFIRIPFDELVTRQDELDIAMVMPHIEWKLNAYQGELTIPFYVIPYKAILLPTIEDFIEDAEDVIEQSGGKGGKFSFPGEESTAKVSRNHSHRKMIEAVKLSK